MIIIIIITIINIIKIITLIKVISITFNYNTNLEDIITKIIKL